MRTPSMLIVFLFAFGLFNLIAIIHSRDCVPKMGDCAAEDAEHCTTGCSRTPEGCDKGVDRFGNDKKDQCHCKELRFCNFSQNGHCNGQGCIFGYEGPNCQKRLYHTFLSIHPETKFIFEWNRNIICRNLTQSIQFNHIYRIQQIQLQGNISNIITDIFGSGNQSLQCESKKEKVVTKLLCTGDITTDMIQMIAEGSCITRIKLFGCSPGWFGEECAQKCHCQHDSACHQLTGVCRDGCEKGWHGENCQKKNYVNIALDRPASQSSIKKKNYIFNGKTCKERKVLSNANSVVDGNNLVSDRMCSYTKWENNPSWMVKLDKNYTISQLRIYTNNHYKIIVYIGANKTPCFKRGKGPKSNVIDVTCTEPQIGDSVNITINAKSAILNLCEVEVLQCLTGFYGHLCHERCNMCQQNECDQDKGHCIYCGCHNDLALLKEQQQKSSLELVLIVIIILVLLAFCLTVAYKYCKSKRYRRYRCNLSHIPFTSSVQDNFPAEETIYIQPIATELNKENILIYVQQKKRKLEPFSKDFSDLPCNLLFPCTEAQKSENREKNRFQCLLPYDHSRVVLQPDASSPSDYINASFIEDKKYISTQVPTAKTMVDFWRMIWQQNCSVIVLLTSNDQPGYIQHLPEVNGTLNFGSISVQGILWSSHKYYTVSKYIIFQSDSKPFVSRSLTQFNFTSWPEGMIPSKPEYILNFRQKVNSCSNLKYPIVVQSRAGAGSTGTYICLDIILERLDQNKPLNTSYSIRRLYDERGLIFTKRAQLEFVYDTLTESMITSGCDIDINNLKEEIDRISIKDQITNLSLADKQYLDIIEPIGQENSVNFDLLEELYSDKRNLSTQNYEISSIEGYEEDKFILAKSPDQHFISEFWNISDKHQCSTIVTFRNTANEIAMYLPKRIGQSLNFGPFNLELINFTDKGLFQCSVLRISYAKEESFHYSIVNHFDATFWPDKYSLPPCKDMLNFIVTVSQQNSRSTPIAVHCSDDYFQSGIFCAIYSAISMVKAAESSVNIVRLLRQMKKAQPKILTNQTSYTYCLDVIKTLIGNESHYSEAK